MHYSSNYGLDECPSCDTADIPLKQGPNLFLCVFCHTLYSVIPAIVSGEEVLEVSIYGPNEVDCPYSAGGHRQRCRASHPTVEDHDAKGRKIECPYATSIGSVEGKYKNPLPAQRDY